MINLSSPEIVYVTPPAVTKSIADISWLCVLRTSNLRSGWVSMTLRLLPNVPPLAPLPSSECRLKRFFRSDFKIGLSICGNLVANSYHIFFLIRTIFAPLMRRHKFTNIPWIDAIGRGGVY